MKRNTLVWAAIGGIAVTGIYLVVRKKDDPALPPTPPAPPQKVDGEIVKVSLAVPAGWRRVTSAEVSALPELASQANALRNTPGFTTMQYGTLAPFVASNGQTYATWVEQHYHPPGGAAKPWGLHHGVTLLASV